MSDACRSLTEVIGVACRAGPAAGLVAGWPADLAAPSSPRGLCIMPAALVRDDPALASGELLPGAAAVALAAEGLVVLRRAGSTAGADADAVRWERLLVAVRVGVARRLLDLAVAHLGGRRFDGAPLTSPQLVRAAVADVATAIEICTRALDADGSASGTALCWVHERQDEADRILAGMFGGAGYLSDHEARCLHVTALLRDLWTRPTTGAGGLAWN